MRELNRPVAISGRRVQIELDEFGHARVKAEAERCEVTVDEFISRAARLCLTCRDSPRVAWRVPEFTRHAPPLAGSRRTSMNVVLQLADDAWRALEAESGRQRVSVERLVQHAALFLLAQLELDGAL